MIEFLFCPQHGIITANIPFVIGFAVAARIYAHKLISIVLRWF